jgi:tetratricopeptide (TPR) repeat protein
MRHVARVAAGVATVLLMAGSPAVRAQSESDSLCAGARQRPDVVAARVELQQAPDALGVRFKLGDLLLNGGCYHDAVDVLEAGEILHPHNAELQYRLTRARSMLKEKAYFDGVDRAEASAELRRQSFRCMQLADPQACDAAQAAAPGNADIALGKGNALLKANRIDDAISAYSHAAQLSPGNALIASKLQSARAQRQGLMQKCTGESGESALQACQSVLAIGSPSEFDVRLRIALLQQNAHQPAQALDSYIAANSLQPGDKSVALAILALLDSTQRRDALGLEARGSALMTLGRTAEALAALRQAATLAPGLPDVQKQLAAAEAQGRVEAADQADAARRDKAVVRTAPRATASKPVPVKVSETTNPPRPSFSNDEPASSSN